jgi:hypothetical protein
MPNLDIRHAANLLIQVRGPEKAEQEAVRNAARLGSCGEVEGQNIWLLIRRAIIDLQSWPSARR